MTDDSKKNSSSYSLVPLICVMFALFALMVVATRSNYYGGGGFGSAPKLTSIPANNPAVAAFKAFAETNKLRWSITIGISGTTYCAHAETMTYMTRKDFFSNVECEQSLRVATEHLMADWNNRNNPNIRLGSDEE